MIKNIQHITSQVMGNLNLHHSNSQHTKNKGETKKLNCSCGDREKNLGKFASQSKDLNLVDENLKSIINELETSIKEALSSKNM